MAAGVAELKTSREDSVKGSSGYDTKLSVARNGFRKTPIRHSGSHAALDDDGEISGHSLEAARHLGCTRGRNDFHRICVFDSVTIPMVSPFLQNLALCD